MDLDPRSYNPYVKFSPLQYRYGFWLWSCKRRRGLVWRYNLDRYDWFKIFYPVFLALICFCGNAAAMTLFSSIDTEVYWIAYAQVNLLTLVFVAKFSMETYLEIRKNILDTRGEQIITLDEFLTSPYDIHREFGRRFAKEFEWI